MDFKLEIHDEGLTFSKAYIEQDAEILFKKMGIGENKWLSSSKYLHRNSETQATMYFQPNLGERKEIGKVTVIENKKKGKL